MNDRFIPNQDVVDRVDQTFTDLDRQRTQGLERFQQIQTVQNAALEREQQRLIAKYGVAHPRVQKATARLTYNQGLQRELSQEVERSKIDVPQIDRNTWLGHGFVLNKNLLGLQGLTISFVDAQNNWIRELGYACTDAQGYFSLLYPSQTTQTPSNPDLPPIFLTVTNADRQILHRESTSRTVKLGQVDFWRIVLGSEDGSTCEPPEPDKPPPGKAVQVVDLTAPDTLTVNQSGSFSAKVNDDATPPVTTRWDFGDSTTADGLTATHAYTKPGSYTVTFIAANAAGKDSRTSQLRVRNAPNAPQIGTIKATPESPTTNTSVQFTAEVKGDAPLTYQWDFGDGTSSAEVAPVHTYAQATTYAVKLAVANAAGTDTRSLQLTVNKPKPLTWTVRGQVLNAAGQPATGLTVGLVDPQNRFEPRRLEATLTDEKGNYTLAYSSDTFPELFEIRPELLVRVSDRQNPLFTTDNSIRCTPGSIETVNITLRERKTHG